jgi:hypothetical protein
MSEVESIFLSENCRYTMRGSGYFRILSACRMTDIWFDGLCYMPGNGTLFPLHDLCIEISCRAIDDMSSWREDIRHQPSIAVLCDLLNRHWKDRRKRLTLSDGTANDIFGLCTYSKAYGPCSVLAMTRVEWWASEYDVGNITTRYWHR